MNPGINARWFRKKLLFRCKSNIGNCIFLHLSIFLVLREPSMIRKLLLWSIALSLVLGCQAGKKLTRPQHQYFPQLFRNVYLGIPLKQFQSIYSGFAVEQKNFRSEVFVPFEDPVYQEVVYYFGPQPPHPLYQFNITYRDSTEAIRTAKKLYKKPNFQKNQWKFDSGEGFPVWIWRRGNTLHLVGQLPNTEWAVPR